ncbi:MAG: aminopeptidase [Longimicrobiales bacterium]|nr:aminopeptidase [Longimicrobiales bacterium]
MCRLRALRATVASCLASTLLALAACGREASPPPPQEQPAPLALNMDALAGAIVDHLALQPGERVLLAAQPGRFDSLVGSVRAGVQAAGATDLGAWSVEGAAPSEWGTDFTRGLEGLEGEALVEALSGVDAGIMLPGAVPAHPVYGALQQVLRGGHGRTVHFHWAGAYGLDGALLAMDPARDALYQAVVTGTDYTALAATHRAFEEALRAGEVRVTTPAGTDLTFRVADRPVTKQDGDASGARAASGRNLIDREVELPAGAIRVAPLEETVRGRIVFPPSVWNGERVEGLTLGFVDGVATEVTASAGLAAALAEMDAAGPAGRSFREFALGFNPLLTIPEADPWIPYYGYGAGVVRLSLGDNTELGGAVGGGYVRWNFFTDATVTAGSVTWVDGGRLTPPSR